MNNYCFPFSTFNVKLFFFSRFQRVASQPPPVATDRCAGVAPGRQVPRHDVGDPHTPLVVETERKGETAILAELAQAPEADNRGRGRLRGPVGRVLRGAHGTRPDHRAAAADRVHAGANGRAGQRDRARLAGREPGRGVRPVAPVLQADSVHCRARGGREQVVRPGAEPRVVPGGGQRPAHQRHGAAQRPDDRVLGAASRGQRPAGGRGAVARDRALPARPSRGPAEP